MAAFVRAHRAYLAPASEPNVIPFIDVLLVLLIIFMVTAPKPTTDLRVDLPRAGPARVVAIPPTIVELHQTAGVVHVFVASEEVLPAQLAQRALAHALSAQPALTADDALSETPIYVRADLDVAYNDVVTTVESLQRARFRRVAIAAQHAD